MGNFSDLSIVYLSVYLSYRFPNCSGFSKENQKKKKKNEKIMTT